MTTHDDQPVASKPKTEEVDKAFDLLAPGVQRQLWRMGWTELRPIQVEAIQVIMLTDVDCVIAAETASGKTEAAFLPILSKIADQPTGSIRAMYVGPLRALINDQFERVEELCNYLEVPTHRWHGDVGASAKSKLLKQPGGVLLITPESLESLFVNRSHQLSTLFNGLGYVVIDELHSFLGNERGAHLRSLLCRLRRLIAAAGSDYRVAGLSATIGDFGAAQRYVNPNRPDDVTLIRDEQGRKELRYRLYAYVAPTSPDTGGQRETSPDEPEGATMRQIAEDLVEHCRGSSNLVFANAKSDIELYADLCKEAARREGLPESFVVHHASLARDIREDTEAEMKGSGARTTICSSTLEMGIDIGGVRMVGQIGAPWSVTSLKQRLGRSGRKDTEPRVMRVYVPCSQPSPDAGLLPRLHLELIQAIAVTELLLQGWVEPPAPPRCDLSTLTQQIISVIAQTGGTAATELYDRLVHHGAFQSIELGLFKDLLHSLGKNDIIEQMSTGELILGLEGERIRSGRDFYAAFQTPAEFSVTTGEKQIGTLPLSVLPAPGDHLLLAGRRWSVVHVDLDRAEIVVQPAKGRKPPLFPGQPGVVHGQIREQMREVLRSDQRYVYLNSTASTLLSDARHVAEEAHISAEPLVPLGTNRTLWFTWAGTHVQTTLAAMLAATGISTTDRDVALEIDRGKAQVLQAVERLARSWPNREQLAASVQPKLRRKYDYLLTDELLNTTIVRDVLDVDVAIKICRRMVDASNAGDSDRKREYRGQPLG